MIKTKSLKKHYVAIFPNFFPDFIKLLVKKNKLALMSMASLIVRPQLFNKNIQQFCKIPADPIIYVAIYYSFLVLLI